MCGSLGTACSDGTPAGAPSTSASEPTQERTAPGTESEYRPEIVPTDFSTTIDNPFLPFVPGTRMTYEGETDEGLEEIVVEVLSETKTVMGVECVVVHDTVRLDGEIIEDTFDWYAQHRDGSVWYFGEDTTEYENGEVVGTAGAWEAGVDGAQPGIVMLADPQTGDHYRQEYYVGEAEDMADVLAIDGTEAVPYGRYEGLLVTKDYTPLEPELVERKYYARGVGFVLEVMVSPDTERIELVDIEQV